MEQPVCYDFSVSFRPTDHNSDDFEENDLPSDAEDNISHEDYANLEDEEGAKQSSLL
jgi:hypothetical protein